MADENVGERAERTDQKELRKCDGNGDEEEETIEENSEDESEESGAEKRDYQL